MSVVTFTAGQVLEAQQLNDSFAAVLKEPTVDTVTTSQSTSSTSYTDLSTSGPAVTVTTGTTALVVLSAGVDLQNFDAHGHMSFAVSGASTISAADINSLSAITGNSTGVTYGSRVLRLSGLTAGSNTFTAKYRVTTANPAAFNERQIMVIAL